MDSMVWTLESISLIWLVFLKSNLTHVAEKLACPLKAYRHEFAFVQGLAHDSYVFNIWWAQNKTRLAVIIIEKLWPRQAASGKHYVRLMASEWDWSPMAKVTPFLKKLCQDSPLTDAYSKTIILHSGSTVTGFVICTLCVLNQMIVHRIVYSL